MLKAFFENKQGSILPTFAIALIPLIASVGAFVDYNRIAAERTALQMQADAEALERREGSWIANSVYKVEKTSSVKTAFLNVIGIHNIAIQVSAEATFGKPVEKYVPPVLADLDPEAADYNQLSFYCYNPLTGKRSKEVVVADNAGTQYNDPVEACVGAEERHQSLRNVRNARTDPRKWHDPRAVYYVHYTDNQDMKLVETFLCDRAQDCKGRSEGGILPEGTNRTPNVETRLCAPGKYMYYGWEDRANFDADYNDIRIVMTCPQYEVSGEHTAWLSR